LTNKDLYSGVARIWCRHGSSRSKVRNVTARLRRQRRWDRDIESFERMGMDRVSPSSAD